MNLSNAMLVVGELVLEVGRRAQAGVPVGAAILIAAPVDGVRADAVVAPVQPFAVAETPFVPAGMRGNLSPVPWNTEPISALGP